MSTYAANAARAFILSRRGAGIANLQDVTLFNGDFTLDQAEVAGVYKVNCTHQVGIATSTEVGLSSDRYPVKVIICGADDAILEARSETVSGYWKVATSSGNPIIFSRKPLVTERPLKNLFKYVPDLNDDLWKAYNELRTSDYTCDRVASADADNEVLYALLDVENPTDDQISRIAPLVGGIIASCKDVHVVPYFKISVNAYLVGEPHGRKYSEVGTINANRVALAEFALCAKINQERLKRRYDDLSEGIVTLSAYTVAAMFRLGLQESYEHKEYYTVYLSPTGATANEYSVSHIVTPAGAPEMDNMRIGKIYSVGDVKVKKQFIELGNLMVVTSGLMHYLFNHTTGGVLVSGALLTILTMYQFINRDAPEEEHIKSTSLIYEALHPSNKRAVANLFFKTAGVTTHGRCSTAPAYERFELDSFTQIRVNPYPAGSHKAFICLQALKRVIQSGMAPFLPWADQMSNCIQSCKVVLKNGARAHIGSGYYTGEPAIAQPTSLDNYLPELAQFVHTFNKGDSLTFSPHLSVEMSKKASMNWQNLLRDMKAKDVSATSTDIVRKFLATSGSVHFSFDPNDEGTWAKAVQDAKVADNAINEMFL